MADEYNSTTNWWDSSRNRFDTAGSSSSSSSSTSSGLNSLGTFSWPSEMVVDHVKGGRSSIESASVSDTCSVFHDHNKDSCNELHMMNLGLSSPAMDWNQALLRGENSKHESSFRSMLQENSSYHHHQHQQQQQQESSGQVQWGRDSSINDQFNKQIHQRGFSLDQQPQFSPHESSTDSTVTCQGFQIDSSAIYGSPSTMLQGLLGSDNQQQQQQSANNYSYGTNYGNELVPCWSKVPQFLRNSPPKQTPQNQLHFSNNAPFWNASAGSMNEVRPSFFNSVQPQFPASNFEEKPKNINQVRDSSTTVKKSGNEPATKRPRNETPSPVPAFKVRKEKMGDRITALQQLVSPFGKTDTASVLSEAIEYIKFLHEQVTVLSSPYMKSGAPITHHQQSCNEKSKDGEGQKQDLRSRGLCLVPLTSTFPVTHETTVDIWSPTFGGYR
ncbi:transcription factor bHLH123 isoform X2 [Euphorbia lathyris]|uniref:transcription factor bHLH123 isoform X2 n=1 Tax=Euphorbia lathyris TaxID=212925 RepID=UPI003313AEE4